MYNALTLLFSVFSFRFAFASRSSIITVGIDQKYLSDVFHNSQTLQPLQQGRVISSTMTVLTWPTRGDKASRFRIATHSKVCVHSHFLSCEPRAS